MTFRYAIRPHRGYSAPEAARFGISVNQPLLAAPARGAAPASLPLRVAAEGAIATALKPSDDGRAWILRLHGASGRDERARIEWTGDRRPARTFLSDASERPIAPLQGDPLVPGWGLVTLRAEMR